MDFVLGVLAVEVVFVAVALRRGKRTVRLKALWPNLAAGLFLVLALRSAVHGHGVLPIAGYLALAGVSHALDLRRRAAD